MFDEEYKKNKLYWDKNPNKIVEFLLKYKSSGNVLDLGFGEGRNALFLAKHGFNVTGVDISKEGIKKFSELAKKQNLKIKAINEDIRNFKFDKKYDILISIATLHFLNKGNIESIIKKIKDNTSKGGLNVISVFTEERIFSV